MPTAAPALDRGSEMQPPAFGSVVIAVQPPTSRPRSVTTPVTWVVRTTVGCDVELIDGRSAEDGDVHRDPDVVVILVVRDAEAALGDVLDLRPADVLHDLEHERLPGAVGVLVVVVLVADEVGGEPTVEGIHVDRR